MVSQLKSLSKFLIHVAFQVTKATGKFLLWSHFGGWRFNDWNAWRMKDGMLCRNTDDCSWLDRNLLCQDYELDISPSRAWFGGDFASIVGKCQCGWSGSSMDWNSRDLECQSVPWSAFMIFIFCLTPVVLVGLAVLYYCVCCKRR